VRVEVLKADLTLIQLNLMEADEMVSAALPGLIRVS
jgi:hypothetical protein